MTHDPADDLEACCGCGDFLPAEELTRIQVGGEVLVVCSTCYPDIAEMFDAPHVIRPQAENDDDDEGDVLDVRTTGGGRPTPERS